MLTGIQNFLQFINDNWTSITVILSLIVALYLKVKDYLSKTRAERIEIAKTQIKKVILKKITDAETEYDTWVKAGAVKRSQVIQEIYMEYPILGKAVDQNAVVEWIDEQINAALKTLRKIVAENVKPDENVPSGA